MKAIRRSFFQMAKAMVRDRMLFAACFIPILAGLFFRLGLPFFEAILRDCLSEPVVISPGNRSEITLKALSLVPYYRLVDILYAMLSPAMFCFVSAMVSLEEADEKTAAYLFVTPLGKGGYLAARFWIPSGAAFLMTVALLPIFKLTSLSPVEVILLGAGGTLQGVILSLLIVTFSSNKLEGMAVSKLSSLMLFGATGPFFLEAPVQYALSPLPSFWIGKAIFDGRPSCMLPAFALSAFWIALLLRRYLL